MTHRFHPEALAEAIEAAQVYESRQAGLGVRFTDHVARAVAALIENPEGWPLMEGEDSIYRCPVRKFPYGILFAIEHDIVEIVAVMHLHRRPGYWKSRLG